MASTQKKVTTKRVMAELELNAKVKPTLRGLLLKITPMLQGKSKRYYDQKIPMSKLNTPVDIKYTDKEILIKVEGRTTRVSFPGEKNHFATVNGIPLSEADLENYYSTLKKLKRLYSSNQQSSPSLIDLILNRAHADIPWTGILIGAGVALLGFFIYKGINSMANSTHTVNVQGEVKVDVPTDYELEVPISGTIENGTGQPIVIDDDVLDDIEGRLGNGTTTSRSGVLR